VKQLNASALKHVASRLSNKAAAAVKIQRETAEWKRRHFKKQNKATSKSRN